MPGLNKQQRTRQYRTKKVWYVVLNKFLSRTSFCWGKTAVAKEFNVSLKTIDNMVNLISQGVYCNTATQWKGGES